MVLKSQKFPFFFSFSFLKKINVKKILKVVKDFQKKSLDSHWVLFLLPMCKNSPKRKTLNGGGPMLLLFQIIVPLLLIISVRFN
jgi:hypothetical protein